MPPRGEINDGYSFHFRHVEFEGALEAVSGAASTTYENALSYDGDAEMPDHLRFFFDESMQYVEGIDDIQHAMDSASRCSLVHALYQVIAIEDSYTACSDAAIENGGFSDMCKGGSNQDDTWCVRVRHYGDAASHKKAKRHGARARSMEEEKKAMQDMTPLFEKLAGRVDLKNPDCKIYLFNGLKGKTVLVRRVAKGPPVYQIAPATRICITNTPLEPIASFSMCNIASVRDGQTLLDPYAGSCATLLAAAMMAPGCKTVGIEVAHDGIVNRDDIMRDFETRDLTPPLALIEGDSTDDAVRDQARSEIAGDPFDVIVTDPPYGIRESMYDQDPLCELFNSIARDREAGKPLLRVGGKIVAFVPCTDEETIDDCLPSDEKVQEAGLELLDKREQPLNEKLSRWLVSYRCVK